LRIESSLERVWMSGTWRPGSGLLLPSGPWSLFQRSSELSSTSIVPVFLALLVGIMLGLLIWGFVRVRRSTTGDVLAGTRDMVLAGLLALALLAMVLFLVYALFNADI
jgi:phosphotransferase system  glucose/maltose/N-acetylglucosamine-specific IIC component